jgi:hypothetical protein
VLAQNVILKRVEMTLALLSGEAGSEALDSSNLSFMHSGKQEETWDKEVKIEGPETNSTN